MTGFLRVSKRYWKLSVIGDRSLDDDNPDASFQEVLDTLFHSYKGWDKRKLSCKVPKGVGDPLSW